MIIFLMTVMFIQKPLPLTAVRAAKLGRKGNVVHCNAPGAWAVKGHFKDYLWRQTQGDRPS